MTTVRPRSRRVALLAASLSCASLVAVGVAAGEGQSASARGNAALAAVTNPDGSPKKGFDPASQPQTSLHAAAGKAPALPRGPKVDGSVGANPDAVGVNSGRKKQVSSGPASRRTTPSEIVTTATANGGCRTEYGGRGQCLPVVPPSHAAHPDHPMDHAWSCAEVRTLLPRGMPLVDRSVDPLGLDSNGDGVACGRGDA